VRALPPGLVVAWYGDDFTGSAAVMEVLSFAGLGSVLFFEPPSAARLARFPGVRGVGVAGDARSRSPAWMRAELPGVFAALRALGPAVLHYKVCSTLDSSPEVGSIGAAADVALEGGGWAPLVVAAPRIGRWQAFGTLFVRAGGGVHRLDRHEAMRNHPVTPMDEADVRLHLARQTARWVGLVDLLELKAGRGAAGLARERKAGASVVALDVIDEETLAAAGRLVWEAGAEVAIGSQGVEYALVAAWREAGLLGPEAAPRGLAAAERIVGVSGSCSPVTAEQLTCAEAAGFAVVGLAVGGDWAAECERGAEAAVAALKAGRSAIVATARGPVGETRGSEEFNARIGTGLGRVLDWTLRETGVRRAVIAGGDTSSHGARELGLFALTAEAAAAPGAALLRGWSEDAGRDGIEIALKGGQMGPPDFFVRIRDGGAAAA
jgi:uncharacterized protein YgbK (DUF1537 family)